MTVKTLSNIVHGEGKIDLPNDKRIVPLPDDLLFVIDTRDNIEELHDLSKGKGHEPHMIEKMMDFAQTGETYIEVGSHYGDFALRMSKKVGAEGVVYGFEPNKNLYQCFSTSIFLNGITNVVAKNFAVLDQEQEIGFFEDTAVTLMSKVATVSDNYNQTIKAITLDDYFKGKESTISIIRVDAEGSECRILRGAQNIIDSSPNIKLFIEWQSVLLKKYESTASLQECLYSLINKGFILLDTAEFNKKCDYKNYQLSVNDIVDDPILEVLAIKENTLQNLVGRDHLSNQAEECLVGLNNLLHLSINRKNAESIKFALSEGANIDSIPAIGVSALYWAVQEQRFEIAKILVEAGANLEIKAINNMTPLTMSVQNRDFNMTKLLIEAGANLENPNGQGFTPLYLAVHFGYDDILQLLIENGANKNAKVQGISAFQAALQKDSPDTAIILAGSSENFCQQIQATEYAVKYSELCGEIKVEL